MFIMKSYIKISCCDLLVLSLCFLLIFNDAHSQNTTEEEGDITFVTEEYDKSETNKAAENEILSKFDNLTEEEAEKIKLRLKYEASKGRKTIFPVSHEYIASINREQTHWKAGKNFCKNVSVVDLNHLIGTPYPNGRFLVGSAKGGGAPTGATGFKFGVGVAVGGAVGSAIGSVVGTVIGGASTLLKPDYWWDKLTDEIKEQVTKISLPDTFDGRKDWGPECSHVVSTIADTGLCASSWALSVAQSIHDRYCVFYRRDDRTFSAKYLMDCCPNCGHQRCKGGSQEMAYEFFYKEGVPTGMNKFASRVGCQPYSIKPSSKLFCKSDHCTDRSVCSEDETDFYCNNNCTNNLYVKLGRNPDMDLFIIHSYFYRHPRCMFFFTSSKAIKAEILLRGSVTAKITIWDDFLNYKKGVYYPTKGSMMFGEIVVRIIGWGNDKGQDYWLAANVWGPNWGDQGFVKLRAWDKHLNIEERIMVARIAKDKCAEED